MIAVYSRNSQQTIPFNWTKSWENDLQVLILSDRIQFANKQDIFWGCHVCIWKITNLTKNLNYNNHNFVEQGNRLNLRPEVSRYQRKFSLIHYTLTSVCIFFKLLSLHNYPKVLTRRICLTIKSWWSFPLFSWP